MRPGGFEPPTNSLEGQHPSAHTRPSAEICAQPVYDSACARVRARLRDIVFDITTSLDLRLTSVNQLQIQRCLAHGCLRGLDVVEVEERLDRFQIPFGLARFYVNNLASALALGRMGREVADDAHGFK